MPLPPSIAPLAAPLLQLPPPTPPRRWGPYLRHYAVHGALHGCYETSLTPTYALRFLPLLPSSPFTMVVVSIQPPSLTIPMVDHSIFIYNALSQHIIIIITTMPLVQKSSSSIPLTILTLVSA
jgi:hypothetical protein